MLDCIKRETWVWAASYKPSFIIWEQNVKKHKRPGGRQERLFCSVTTLELMLRGLAGHPRDVLWAQSPAHCREQALEVDGAASPVCWVSMGD